jgi:hypothetical protein
MKKYINKEFEQKKSDFSFDVSDFGSRTNQAPRVRKKSIYMETIHWHITERINYWPLVGAIFLTFIDTFKPLFCGRIPLKDCREKIENIFESRFEFVNAAAESLPNLGKLGSHGKVLLRQLDRRWRTASDLRAGGGVHRVDSFLSAIIPGVWTTK